MRQEIEATAIGQVHIADQHIELFQVAERAGFYKAGGSLHTVATASKQQDERTISVYVIIDQENFDGRSRTASGVFQGSEGAV